jgi:hypothetical protein
MLTRSSRALHNDARVLTAFRAEIRNLGLPLTLRSVV